jgi:hypothetical protein
MSYTTSGGPYATYSPDDVAALMWLYGGDGLGGSLGQGTPGLYLVGTSGGDVLAGGTGDDVFDAKGGNDRLVGGAGTDTARYSGNRSAYTITASAGGFTISGPEGTDSLAGIELARFADTQLTLSDQPPNSAPTGSLSIGGMARWATRSWARRWPMPTAWAPVHRWQASADGKAADLAGATSTSLTPRPRWTARAHHRQLGRRPRQRRIGHQRGHLAGAHVNDAPTGTLTLIGTAPEQALTGNQTRPTPTAWGPSATNGSRRPAPVDRHCRRHLGSLQPGDLSASCCACGSGPTATAR